MSEREDDAGVMIDLMRQMIDAADRIDAGNKRIISLLSSLETLAKCLALARRSGVGITGEPTRTTTAA